MTPTAKDDATPDELKSKFGEEADLYAEVRAEAADAAGKRDASRKWNQIAEQLKDDTAEDDRE